MDWSSLLATFPKEAVPPLFGALVGSLVGGSLTLVASITAQYLTHCFTRQREVEKLQREKAEELIHALYQHRNRLTTWRFEIMGWLEHGPPEPVEHGILVLLDLDRLYTIQRLYFPPLWDRLEAVKDALIPLVEWLQNPDEHQDTDAPEGREQALMAICTPLQDAYDTACEAAVEAIARAVPTGGFFRTVRRWWRRGLARLVLRRRPKSP